jgi:tetratricopeptide (TPR) repeat protein
VLTGVFEQADPFGRPGPDLTLGQALIEGYDHIARQVAHDPVLAARVFNQLGGIFSQLGMYAQSERAYRHSLETIPAAAEMPPIERLTAIAGLAATTNDQGRFLDTLAFVDGFSLGASQDAAEARVHVQLLFEQVEALQASDQHGAAQARLATVQALIGQFGLTDPGLLFTLHNALANAARHAGDFASAVRHSREAAAYAGEAGNPGAQATLLQNLGIYLARQGRLDDAEPYFLEAMAIIDAQAPGHPRRLEYSVNYAGWLYRVGRLESAVTLLRDTLAALHGTPDRHLWAYANRDLATYAFATGDIEDSLRANREYLLAAPELYGGNAPQTAAAEVLLARHLSLAGLHEAALEIMQRALTAHPVISNFNLAAYLAEMRLDAGQVERAMREYDPFDAPDDPNATLLGLKFMCAVDDLDALAARVQALEPDALAGGSHLDRRLLAWRHLMAAALARHAGEDPAPELEAAYSIVAETPRLSTIEEWRLLRELLSLYPTPDAVPAGLRSAWDSLTRQQALARTMLQNDYLPADTSAYRHLSLSYMPRRPLPLACLR